MILSSFRWRLPAPVGVDPACRPIAAESGLSERLLAVLAARGVRSAEELTRFLAPAEDGLHDPRLLPDAEVALRRVALARTRGERVLVYGDFDADGLTGLAILVIALRRLGLDVEPYVPERLGDGHGLSLKAIARAEAEGRTLIVTADCGTSSAAEIDLAADRGIDVLVTDHHHAATWPARAVGVVNPQRADSDYPDHELTGAGVAWKVAHLLSSLEDWPTGPDGSPPSAPGELPAAVRNLSDLALIGTVADVAPILGENRCIARIGLEQLRSASRPGLAALIARAGLNAERLNLDDIGFALAPRLNAAGRVGEAARAETLLLAGDRVEADALAAEIDAANRERRELTKTAVAEARIALGLTPGAEMTALTEPPVLPAALLIRGEWPVGIIGLVAGRLAEDLGRPSVVATFADEEAGILRGSCRSPKGFNLAGALIECGDLLDRHGGHAAAAGFDIAVDRWSEFQARFLGLAALADLPPGRPELWLDMVVPAPSVDYALVRELAMLEPTGPGNPVPLLAVTGLRVVRARSAAGGHTQLVLGRGRDVLDAVAFRRPDLATMLRAGDMVDVVARATSRRFGGFESIQLEVLDVAAEGSQVRVEEGATG
ncbi:MAG TPA: single-stranded-DNA-specific exonuclease RecJ [Candidatus Limnocylindrales bacterium]